MQQKGMREYFGAMRFFIKLGFGQSIETCVSVYERNESDLALESFAEFHRAG